MGSTAAAIAQALGGPRVLGVQVRSELELARLVEKGLPPRALEALAAHDALALHEAWSLVLPRRTWLYRKAHHQRLTPVESDRASRLARIASLAVATFGRADLAHTWLRRRSRALGGSTPLDLLSTDAGTRVVEDELVRISDGVYA